VTRQYSIFSVRRLAAAHQVVARVGVSLLRKRGIDQKFDGLGAMRFVR